MKNKIIYLIDDSGEEDMLVSSEYHSYPVPYVKFELYEKAVKTLKKLGSCTALAQAKKGSVGAELEERRHLAIDTLKDIGEIK